MHKLYFIALDFKAQIQYFIVRVANFEPLYLCHLQGDLFDWESGTGLV